MSGTTPTGSAPTARQGISAAVLGALFVVVAALVFYAVYIAFPANSHFGALLIIGVLALFFALGCYLSESFSRDPTAQRSLAWGFLGMGFATLFLSVGLGPSYGVESTLGMLEGLIVLVILLMIVLALLVWRSRTLGAESHREVARQAWDAQPPVSAFSYGAANAPSAPTTSPPPSPPSSPPSGGS
jgi:hypothetical protein